LQELILLASSRDCKALITVAVYGQNFSSYIALAADDCEMLVSCARQLSDFCGVCSTLAPILSSLSSISTQHSFLAGLLSRSDPVDLILLISVWMLIVLGSVIPGNYNEIFSDTF
jgi:hypothetical protein